MVAIIVSFLIFVVGCLFYWKVSKPLGELPTYEDLKAMEKKEHP